MKKSKLFIPFIVTIAFSLILAASFLLPFASATDEYREYLLSYPDAMNLAEINMTNADSVNISLLGFIRIYGGSASLGMFSELGIIYVIISCIGLFSLFTLVFAVLKKPVPTIVFTVLSFIVFLMIKWDFTDRGIIPSVTYNWGVSHYIYYIIPALTLASAIWLLTIKIKAKKHFAKTARDGLIQKQDNYEA